MGSCLKLLERPKKFTSNPVAATSILINKRCNRLFPSSLVPLFQSESKCETILMKMTDLHEIETACKTHFHMNGLALRLVLKQIHKRSWKRPIGNNDHSSSMRSLPMQNNRNNIDMVLHEPVNGPEKSYVI